LTLETNAAARILFAQKEEKLAREIAEELGTETVKTRSTSRSRHGGGGKTSAGETTAETRRPLLLPQEIKTLGQDQAIIVLEHTPPIRARKIVYYRDRVLKQRPRPPVAVAPIDVPRHDGRGPRRGNKAPTWNAPPLAVERPWTDDDLTAVIESGWSVLHTPTQTHPAAPSPP
jgi:type IV secretory pathway TraG/TraD family ATPase VirD4